jgi:putative transcriptional regulator
MSSENADRGYLDGRILIAAPGIPDDRLARLIIYVCAHSCEGAMGLALNQRSECTFSELLAALSITPDATSAARVPHSEALIVIKGGPLDDDRGFVLHSNEFFLEGSTLPVDDDICITATLDILQVIARGRGPRSAVLALGYRGWSAGELEDEIRKGYWLHCPADPELIFGADIDGKYDCALRKVGLTPASARDPQLGDCASGRPFMPLRYGYLLCPGEVRMFVVGSPASVAAVRAAFADKGSLVVATLREPDGEMSARESVFGVGVEATVIQLLELSDGAVRIMLEVKDRVHLRSFARQNEGFYRVKMENWPDAPSEEIEVRNLARSAFEHFDALRRRAGLPDEANTLLAAAVGEKFPRLPWAAMHYLGLGLERHWISHHKRQELVEARSLSERLRKLIELLDQSEPPALLASQVTPFLLQGASYLASN